MGMTIQERSAFALMRSEIARLRAENERLRASVDPLDDAEFEALLADLARDLDDLDDLARDLALKPIIRVKAQSRLQASAAAAA